MSVSLSQKRKSLIYFVHDVLMFRIRPLNLLNGRQPTLQLAISFPLTDNGVRSENNF
jgi:hypothetical protein